MPHGSRPGHKPPWGGFVVGAFFFGAASYWSELTGARPSAADQVYLGFFQFLGLMATVSGLWGIRGAILRWIKRWIARTPSETFGNAAFATFEECDEAKLFDPRGLYLGTLEGQPLFYTGKAHLLTVAPARQGKGINAVIPNLLHYQGSVFVTDPKGELAAVTAAHRKERLKQKVIFLNPWGLHGLPQHRFNPLQVLIDSINDPALVRRIADEARALALALLPEPEDARNRFFRDGARTLLRALMLYLAATGKVCTLPEVWRLLASLPRLKRAIREMKESDALFGMLSDLGEDLDFQLNENPDQFADFRQGAAQAVDQYDPVGPLGEAVSASDFDFRELKEGNVTIYCLIPQNRIQANGSWLGHATRQAINSVAESRGESDVLFLLDEFANMGRLAGLAESLTALPGLGVRVWAFVQEFADLIQLYGPHTARTILSQSEVWQFFAIQDLQLAQMISDALGQRTVKTTTFNLGQFDTDEVGESLSETGRPLMSPNEIRMMERDEQLIFINNLSPIKANRMPFWFVKPWASWAEPNPIEGGYPRPRPLLEIEYLKKGNRNG